MSRDDYTETGPGRISRRYVLTLSEQQITRVLRVQGESRATVDVQDHDVPARPGGHGDAVPSAAIRAEAD
jgi:hypothetical protein